VHGKLDSLAVVEVLQGDLKGVLDIVTAFRSRAPAGSPARARSEATSGRVVSYSGGPYVRGRGAKYISLTKRGGLLFLSSLRSSCSPPPPSEKHAEQVVPSRSSPSVIITDTLKSVLVVFLPLVLVTKDLVSSGDLLELLLVAALVGVVLDGKLAVSLLDGRGISALLNS